MDLCCAHGNDAAIQIAVSVAGNVEKFAELMNKKVEELELKDTHFITPHGLDEEGHYTTAYELALITDYALNIEKIREVVKTKTYTVNIDGRSKTINNTNELLGNLNGVNGVKTGFTNGAGRCLVTSVERDGFNIITVVLGADTKKIRTRDSINLIEYIYSNYELVNLEDLINEEFNRWCNFNKNRISVTKGKKKSVKVYLEDYNHKIYPIKKEEIKNIDIDIINIQMCFEAPVYKNMKVAKLKLSIKDIDVLDARIMISEDIQRKNVKDYFIDCIESVV